MVPDEVFMSSSAFGYNSRPRFLVEQIGRSVHRQLQEARAEVAEIVSANRDGILGLAEIIFTERRLSDRALRDALVESGFEPLRTES